MLVSVPETIALFVGAIGFMTMTTTLVIMVVVMFVIVVRRALCLRRILLGLWWQNHSPRDKVVKPCLGGSLPGRESDANSSDTAYFPSDLSPHRVFDLLRCVNRPRTRHGHLEVHKIILA